MRQPLMQQRRVLALLFALSWVAPLPAECFLMRLENTDLVCRSDLVISGVVREIYGPQEPRAAVVEVQCVLKGDRLSRKEVRVIFSPHMAESPEFKVQEHVLLFLQSIGPDLFQTVGGFQGKFSL
jgi:hypothetical protein